MTENKNFEITCGINNIAPVQNLNVIWYKGDTIVHTESLNNAQKSPVNLSPVYNFEPTRKDDGVTFRCEAHMDLGPEGPQFNVSSQEYKIKVYCKYIMSNYLLKMFLMAYLGCLKWSVL